MCGVMGYVGQSACRDILFNGLKRLEYRGYDSAGIAVLDKSNMISLVKEKGKLEALKAKLDQLPSDAMIGIGHTRWATHGKPATKNAHPHANETMAIVHNGIIENYTDLKTGLEAGGVMFKSDTDTEVVLHVLSAELEAANSTKEAIIGLAQKLKGAFSLGLILPFEPDAVYVVKQGSPMAIGIGEGENFFASDVAALVDHTQKALFLEDGEFARITKDEINLWNFAGEDVHRDFTTIEWSAESVEKRGYAHFMLKEIHEQSAVIGKAVSKLIDDQGRVNLDILGLDKIDLTRVQNVHILACGTAMISGMIGKYAFESLAGIPTNVELASEFRYRNPVVDHTSLVIAVTQSGETMDTLESTKYAKARGAQIYCVTNVPYSSIGREADGLLLMDCGPEIGVASTKAFTAMVLYQYIFAWGVATKRGGDVPVSESELIDSLRTLPTKIDIALGQEAKIRTLAEKYFESHNFLYIGRGTHFPLALEGALKLKEISYIHAEGYASGELKHGPIALIDKDMPVVALAPNDSYYDKTLSNIEQIGARNGRVIGIGTEGDAKLQHICEDVLLVPKVEIDALQAIVSVIPLQVFSYYMALLRGTDVDQPRNLAKSVTVE